MSKYLFAMSLGFVGLIWATQNASAQTMACAERAVIVGQLQNRYGETRQSIDRTKDDAVLEVFASPQSGSWTILVTLPDGRACLVASGQSWETLAEVRAASV